MSATTTTYTYESLADECMVRGLALTLRRTSVVWELAVWVEAPPRANSIERAKAKRLVPIGALVAHSTFKALEERDRAAYELRLDAVRNEQLPPILTNFNLDALCDCGHRLFEHSTNDGHCHHYHGCKCRGYRHD